MFVPAGLTLVLRGWPVALSLTVPLAVLLAWDFAGATCIGMQYVTELIPLVFSAAMIGAVRGIEPPERGRAMFSAGLMALAAGAVASAFIGALPYSRRTIADTLSREERAELAGHFAVLNRVAKMVGTREAATLASARLASHLLTVRRLDTVFFALHDQAALRREAGPDRSWIELFDWVALDLTDRTWNHSLADMKRVADAAEAAGYWLVVAEDGVLVYQRPVPGQLPKVDPLSPWRAAESEARQLAKLPPVASAQGIRVASATVWPIDLGPLRPRTMGVRAVLQAVEDHPPEYLIEHRFCVPSPSGQEEVVGTSGLMFPVGGNRPTCWWKKGETWCEQYTVEIRPGVDPQQMTQHWEFHLADTAPRR